ncbi:MAG TPA: indolepyruvate oxidoreductase subunit beta family protein [Alphaproteobacteria bacterium]
MSDPAPTRPLTVLIAALGGEGGGVLASWLVGAATAAGLPVQATSIPGVAQRTGATTYYVEVWPEPHSALGGREPVFGLYPAPGGVDVMVASELVEAGRALGNGYVAPERTLLIASTHRVFAMAEKTAMADGRFDGARVAEAARALAARAVLADLDAIARAAGAPINAVLFGAIAGAEVLPIPDAAWREAIRGEGKAVESNLAGFEAGLGLVRGAAAEVPSDEAEAAPRTALPPVPARLQARLDAFGAPKLQEFATAGVRRLIDFQDTAYARRYLDRVERVCAADPSPDKRIAAEAARQLALRMSFEDVIRVAQLKVRPERIARIRAEAGVAAGQPVRVVEVLKPGIEELCAILPGFVARPVLAWARRRNLSDRLNVGLKISSTSVGGFLLLKALAAMRPLRRLGHRFGEERRLIDDWLGAVGDACRIDAGLALEVADCARLIKGYGETHRRGLANYQRIREAAIAPALAGRIAPEEAAELVRRAREAALADPDGRRLDAVLAAPVPGTSETRAAAE